MKIKIESDVYNISNRVKYIDKGYFILYNTSTSKFEIHNSNQIGSSFCLTVPFKELNEQTLEYINKTKVENIENILSEIKRNNQIRESAEKSSALSNFYDNLQDLRR